MDANELRVGNWVNVPHGDVQIEHFLKDGAHFTDQCGGTFRSLKAIPLTEEWLKKFGFNRQTSHHYYIFHKEKVLFEIYNGSLVIESGYMPLELKYVHQIQNLYFALTGQELTVKELDKA